MLIWQLSSSLCFLMSAFVCSCADKEKHKPTEKKTIIAYIDEYGTEAFSLLSYSNNALSAAQFYSYQLLWDRGHHTTTQADRQSWEQECLKNLNTSSRCKVCNNKILDLSRIYAHIHTHTYTLLVQWKPCMSKLGDFECLW